MRNQWALVILVVFVALAAASVAGAPDVRPASAAPSQVSCTWQNIGSGSRELFHTAGAMDVDQNKLLVYGGAGGDYQIQNDVEQGDLSGTALRATWRVVSASTARALAGAAGAYRARGAADDASAVYFFGGVQDAQTGQGTAEVQRYLAKVGRWERVSPTNASEFRDRMFASAAYDPVHDVLWVVGGIATCALPTVSAGQPCNARSLPTQYLSFDATTGEPRWNTLSGGSQSLYAAAMVYDPVRRRMLVVGGTDTITRGTSDVLALDLSDPDPAKAAFAAVATSGRGPSVYFHGGAYDAAHDWVVVYGGVRQAFMQRTEAVETSTYALDLAASPPAWVDLSPAGNPGVRVGGLMAFDPKHGAVVFALGRDRSDGDLQTVEKIQRTTYALVCAAQATATSGGYPPYPPPRTPTASSLPPGTVQPTATATRSVVPPVPSATATTSSGGPRPVSTCPALQQKVPAQVISDALANPAAFSGYDTACNPNLPIGPWNPLRRVLGLENPNRAYHPLFNTVVWKCGCP